MLIGLVVGKCLNVSVPAPFNLLSFFVVMQNSNHKLVHKFMAESFFLFFSPFFFSFPERKLLIDMALLRKLWMECLFRSIL